MSDIRVLEIDYTVAPSSGDVPTFDGTAWTPQAGGGGGGGAVDSVSNSDTTLIITPTTGDVVASLNLNKANTWLADQSVPDEAYGAGWNGSAEVPTKNAVYDKIQSLTTPVSGTLTITIPANSIEHTETVAATGITAASNVLLALSPALDTDENTPEMLDLLTLSGLAGTDQITVTACFSEPTSGPVKLTFLGA